MKQHQPLFQGQNISHCINELASNYIEKYNGALLHNGQRIKCSSAYDINNGMCVDFASELLNLFGYFKSSNVRDLVYELSSDMFMTHDIDFAEREWGELFIKDEIAWSKDMLNLYGLPTKLVQIPLHVWIYYDGKHYDAECPNGIDKWFELPIFKNCFSD